MPLSHDTLLEFLYSALNAPQGVEVRTSNPSGLRQKLYAAMREEEQQGNTDFKDLSLHLSPVDPQSYLWISHGKKS